MNTQDKDEMKKKKKSLEADISKFCFFAVGKNSDRLKLNVKKKLVFLPSKPIQKIQKLIPTKCRCINNNSMIIFFFKVIKWKIYFCKKKKKNTFSSLLGNILPDLMEFTE